MGCSDSRIQPTPETLGRLRVNTQQSESTSLSNFYLI